MSDDTPPDFETQSSFAAAVAWAFARATARGTRRIACISPAFAEWPLDSPALHERLAAWLRLPGRRLLLLAVQYEDLARRQPRFARWRADWSHAIDALAVPEDLAPELPTALVDDADLSLEVLDPAHWRGRARLDMRSAHAWRERIDALAQRSEPAWPVRSLGL